MSEIAILGPVDSHAVRRVLSDFERLPLREKVLVLLDMQSKKYDGPVFDRVAANPQTTLADLGISQSRCSAGLIPLISKYITVPAGKSRLPSGYISVADTIPAVIKKVEEAPK